MEIRRQRKIPRSTYEQEILTLGRSRLELQHKEERDEKKITKDIKKKKKNKEVKKKENNT